MKKTKTTLIIVLIAAMLLPALNSCKKGEDDPFLSLRSRKARISGEWKIETMKDESSYISSSISSDGSGSKITSSDSWEMTGSIYKINSTADYDYVNAPPSSHRISSGNGTAESSITFKKDGTFTIMYKFINIAMNHTYTQYSETHSNSTVEDRTVETSGTWNFLGGVESDYKNKERIVLNTLKEVNSESVIIDGMPETSTRTFTYLNGEYSEVWHITSLKNKEMVIKGKRSGTGSYTNTFSYDGRTVTVSGTSSSKGEMAAKLIQ